MYTSDAIPEGRPVRMANPANVSSADRLALTVILSLALHSIITLGIVFTNEKPTKPETDTLEIILVQTHSEKAPDKADYLAQANQDGGGNTPDRVRPSSPLTAAAPAHEDGIDTRPHPEQHAAPQANKARPVLQTQRITEKQQPKPAQPAPERTVPKPSASELMNRTIANITAELQQQQQAYAQLPRKKVITARTQEAVEAAYMEAWRQKVEKIGNLNYPDEARRHGLSGNLRLDVEINPDGSIHQIIMRQGSGHKVLDDAALRIVRLAAPFAPLPDKILAETDILVIKRTWKFNNQSNQLSTQ